MNTLEGGMKSINSFHFCLFAGEPLLYLLEMPETSGQVRCEPIEKINPLKINVSIRFFNTRTRPNVVLN